jgi:hypothetical protein
MLLMHLNAVVFRVWTPIVWNSHYNVRLIFYVWEVFVTVVNQLTYGHPVCVSHVELMLFTVWFSQSAALWVQRSSHVCVCICVHS